jgi:hypothetical protein
VSGSLDKTVTGTIDRAGAAAERAQADLASGYDEAAQAPPGGKLAGGALGGRTLTPGVYSADGATLALTGVLTLDGRNDPGAVWVFQATSDLVTAAGSTVRMANSGQACNVFWQVGGSATLGAASTFVGSILALTSVTIADGVTLDGRALARKASVTLAGDTISVPSCSAGGTARPAATPPSGAQAASASVVTQTRHPAGSPVLLLVALLAAAAAVLLGEPRRRRR